MNLLSAAERFAALDRSEVTLDAERCLHTRDRFASCSACYAICPVNAIQPGKPPALDSKMCQSCLACLTHCPTGAYTADDEVSSLLQCVARLTRGTIELLCQRHPNAQVGEAIEATGVRVHSCLAGLGTGVYLLLSVLNVERIHVRLDACAECPWGGLFKSILSQIEQARRLLMAWGKGEMISWVTQLSNTQERPLWDVKNPPISRRDLFRMATHQGQFVLARAMLSEHSLEKKQPGRDRQRIVSAFRRLSGNELSSNISLEGIGFACLEISDACTACQACARICPTGAISYETNDEETYFEIKFTPSLCIGCEACAHACSAKAIRIEHAPTIAQILDASKSPSLVEGELMRCERCNAPFASQRETNLCPVCEFRSTHPFGSFFMPGRGINHISSSEDIHDH